MLKKLWAGWKKFGQWMGDFLARVVLTVFYFTIFLPFGIGVRLFGDPLDFKQQRDELWIPRKTMDQYMEDVRRQS